jgi:hypothetical protein
MASSRAYTTQLQAGLGMIHETLDLLRLWQPGDSAAKLADKAVASGLFSRTTARRARNIAAEMFAPRFLTDAGRPASYLKRLVESNHNVEDLTQLFFIYTARAQAVFADFVIDVYWPRYSAASHTLNRADAEAFIHRALDNGKMQKRWTETTIRRVSGYLLGCCSDFGLIGGASRTDRAIKRFVIRPNVALYLVHELHFTGMSDLSVTRSPDWLLFGLEPSEVIGQLKNLSHDGHLILQATTDLVHIAWNYCSMEDCIGALAQR